MINQPIPAKVFSAVRIELALRQGQKVQVYVDYAAAGVKDLRQGDGPRDVCVRKSENVGASVCWA